MPRYLNVGQSIFLALLAGAGCGKPGASSNPANALVVVANANDSSADDKPAGPAAKDQTPSPTIGGFKFPDDDGGKLLSKLLQPKAHAASGLMVPRSGRIEHPLPPSIARPEVPVAASSAAPPRLPGPARTEARPVPLPDRAPIELGPRVVSVPQRPIMPEGALTKIPARDVKVPAEVPILARPTTTRASLDDPTGEFTALSILSDKLPLRATPAPFMKVNLPDPTENVEAAKVKVVVKEDPIKSIGNPPPPKP
jgi:hypothetical protein